MSRIIIKQPNGLFAEWSTVADDFTMTDATPEEMIAEGIARATEEITEEITAICRRFEQTIPGCEAFLSWEQALERRKEVHGVRAEPIYLK